MDKKFMKTKKSVMNSKRNLGFFGKCKTVPALVTNLHYKKVNEKVVPSAECKWICTYHCDWSLPTRLLEPAFQSCWTNMVLGACFSELLKSLESEVSSFKLQEKYTVGELFSQLVQVLSQTKRPNRTVLWSCRNRSGDKNNGACELLYI